MALAPMLASASPETEARLHFCKATAYVAMDVVSAKEAGMPREMFDRALADLLSQLGDQFTASEKQEIVHFLNEAYASTGTPQATAQRIFDACVKVKRP